MEIEQVAELARAVAALPKPERDFFDGMVADERAKAAEAERIAELRAMTDIDLVRKVLEECTEYAQSYGTGAALTMLREAGFVRADLKLLREAHEALEGVVKAIVKADPAVPARDYFELNRRVMQAATALGKVEVGRA